MTDQTPLTAEERAEIEAWVTWHENHPPHTMDSDTATQTVRRLLATLDARPTFDLTAAWARAEAALPDDRGWFDLFRRMEDFEDPPEKRYCAEGYLRGPGSRDLTAFGPTPAAALLALTERLEAER